MQSSTPQSYQSLMRAAYWINLMLCVFSIPMCYFWIALISTNVGVVTIPLAQVLLPLVTATVAWVTLDVMSRSINGRAPQRSLPYLMCLAGIVVATMIGFFVRFLSDPQGSALALVCMILAIVPFSALLRIIEQGRQNKKAADEMSTALPV